MHDGRVFSDGSHQVWVQLTEEEFKDSFSGKHRDEAIVKHVEKDLLKWVDPGTPHVSRMIPFTAYRQCAVISEDPTPNPDLADDGMSEGGNRSQKKHKTKPKSKSKSKTKTKPKSKSKSKSKTKTKTKSKSKTKTKTKPKTKTQNRVQHFQRLPQSMQVTKVVMGSSAERVCS